MGRKAREPQSGETHSSQSRMVQGVLHPAQPSQQASVSNGGCGLCLGWWRYVQYVICAICAIDKITVRVTAREANLPGCSSSRINPSLPDGLLEPQWTGRSDRYGRGSCLLLPSADDLVFCSSATRGGCRVLPPTGPLRRGQSPKRLDVSCQKRIAFPRCAQ